MASILPQITRHMRVMAPDGSILKEKIVVVLAQTTEEAQKVIREEWNDMGD